MARKFHFCVDISGALRNLKRNPKHFEGAFTDETGKVLSIGEVKMHLLREQAAGHKVIPSSDCDNFDYQYGCQGHEEPDEQGA